MKPKLLLGLALVLGGGWFGCSTSAQPHAKSISRTPNPPSADQVRNWVGYSDSVHFNLMTNYSDSEIAKFGKLKWRRVYEYRKGRSFDGYAIAVFEPGTLWGTNRTATLNHFDNQTNVFMRVLTLPSGRKSYGFLAGFYPGRFSFHKDFDLMITEYGDSYSTYPPEEQLEPLPNPAEDFINLFRNVDEFLDNQP